MTSHRRITTTTFQEMKQHKEKITMLTAYDYSIAKALDYAGVEALLVGDSMGNVMYGEDSTLHVTMEDMIRHTQAVSNASTRAMVIADMPFMSFPYPEKAVENAGRLIKEGKANAVKLEGGRERVASIKLMINSGIAVMGHIGLTPQYFNQMGGYKLQGKTATAAEKLLEDALLLQDAGVFAIVLEMVPWQVAQEISNILHIPTIGIGAGQGCDGQVLVIHDMLGFSDEKPYKFVKQYANIWSIMVDSVQAYIKDVKNQTFPRKVNAFNISEEELEMFKQKVQKQSYIHEYLETSTDKESKGDLISKIYGH